jgi:hypothetical protein
MDIHVYIHSNDDKLDRILRILQRTEQEVLDMSAASDQALADLTAAQAKTAAGVDSAILLLNTIPALLTASGVDPAAVATVTASLNSKADALLAAIAADGPQPAPPGPVVNAASVASAKKP